MRRLLTVLLVLATLAGASAAPDRTGPPQPGSPPSLVMPEILKRQLSNGIPVWIVTRREVPLATVSLLMRAGASEDPAGKDGLASFTADLLEEGAGSRNSLDFAEAVDMLGAGLAAQAGYDATLVGLTVPSRNLAPALDLMADLVLRPTFPKEELARSRAEVLTSFLQARQDPSSLASAAFLSVLFGRSHRYGTGVSGTAAGFATLTRDDVVAFHQAAYRPDRASLVVTGDVQPEAVLRLLEARFGSWKASGPALGARTEPVAPAAGRGLFLVDRPASPQSVLRIGSVGVARDTPDYFPLQVVNTVLGGSFTSRLNQNLREKNGYTYGASSRFAMRLAPGPFSVSTSVQTDKTGPAVGEILSELRAIRDPIPAPELDKSRNYAAYGFPGQFETGEDLAGRLTEMQLYGLPDGYFSEYVGRLLAVDAAVASRAARAHLDPEAMAIVVVGDARALHPQLEALGLGPVKVLAPEDFLGPAVPVPGASRW